MTVTLFRDADYQGASATLDVGSFPDSDKLGAVGNDALTSLRIPAGLEVVLYEHRGFTGRRLTLTADTPNLKAHGFNDITSSVVVRTVAASILKPVGGKYVVDGTFADDALKRLLTADPTVISRLAHLAHALGFGWCGGTDHGKVGMGFDVTHDGEDHVIRARYYERDAHTEGPYEQNRLKITLSNVRAVINPIDIEFDPLVIRTMEPIAAGTHIASNEGENTEKVPVTFEYWKSETFSHETMRKITSGGKVTFTTKWAPGPIGRLVWDTEFTLAIEASISGEKSWTDTKTNTENIKQTYAHEAQVPPQRKRRLDLVALNTETEARYRGSARILFDITFEGFLRWGGNAHKDHPTDRPQHKAAFGDASRGGAEHILALYELRETPGASDWDWKWAEKNQGGALSHALEFLRAPIVAPVAGKFSSFKQSTLVYTSTGPSVPLDSSEIPPEDPRVWEAVPFDHRATDISVDAAGGVWVAADDENGYWRDPVTRRWEQIAEVKVRRVDTAGTGPDAAWFVSADDRILHVRRVGDGKRWVHEALATPEPHPYNVGDVADGLGGAIWILAGEESGGNKAVKRRIDGAWTDMGAKGVAISIGPGGAPWVADANGRVSTWDGKTWTEKTSDAVELAWSPAGPDVMWGVAPGVPSNAISIRKWTGTAWEPAPAAIATRVAVGPDGMPWRVNGKGEIYRLVKR